MSTCNISHTRKPESFIGMIIGGYTIDNVLFLDQNTTLIRCKEINTPTGTSLLEVEHWQDENTFHYNTLHFDSNGDFSEAVHMDMKPQDMRTFEHVFDSLLNDRTK